MLQVSQDALAQLITECTDQFFQVTFIKRTTGEVRHMNARQGVHKYTTGGTLKYTPSEKRLVGVWDRNCEDPAKAYRMIPLDGLLEATINGQHYVVTSVN